MNPVRTITFTLAFASFLVLAGCSTTGMDRTPSTQAPIPELKTEPHAASPPTSPAEIAAHTRDSVVTVTAFSDGRELQSGSGFFIREDGVLVTNLHVVVGADQLKIELPGADIFDNVYVLATDERRDLILLQIPLTNAPALRVADDRETQIGEPVYVLGNPLGLQGTFSNGLVSGKRLENGVSYLQISAPISQGSSGGPVMNEKSEVIGVATSYYEDGQNLNLAVPARHAIGLITLAGAPILFTDIAAEISNEHTEELQARAKETQELMAALPSDIQEDLQGTSSYKRQIMVRSLAIGAVIIDKGWEYIYDSMEIGGLKPGEIDGISVTLAPGRYIVLGVCDDDCTDLDLMVVDDRDNVLGEDFELDAEPIVQFDAEHGGDYLVGVEMVDCAAENCLLAISLFREQ